MSWTFYIYAIFFLPVAPCRSPQRIAGFHLTCPFIFLSHTEPLNSPPSLPAFSLPPASNFHIVALSCARSYLPRPFASCGVHDVDKFPLAHLVLGPQTSLSPDIESRSAIPQIFLRWGSFIFPLEVPGESSPLPSSPASFHRWSLLTLSFQQILNV